MLAHYITLAVLLSAIGLFAVNLLLQRRVKKKVKRNQEMEHMMTQALSMGDYYIMAYDIATDRFTNIRRNLLPDEGLTMQQFLSHIHPDERDTISREMQRLQTGDNDKWELDKRWNAAPEGELPDWHYIHGHAVAEHGDDGQPTHIVNVVKDVTREVVEARDDDERTAKFHQLFDTNLVAMSFYSVDGHLIDLNQNMRLLCEFDEEGEAYFRQASMFDIELFRHDFDRNSREQFHACQHMHYPEIGIDKYIEFRVNPVMDSDGQMVYYSVTARDITEERALYRQQEQRDKELQQASEVINKYENELHYLLENSEMFVVRTDLEAKTVSFSQSLKNMYTQTFDEYLEMVEPEDRQETYNTLHWQRNEPFTTLRHFRHTILDPRPSCHLIDCMPVVGSNGRIVGSFGVSRNVTQLMEAQRRLRHETARADESGKLKSVFLANMTHEIRTPLNAIVGFSDLLQLVDDQQERREFIRIIRNNCDMLLRLINDILEASNMGQALSIEPADVDFAVVFNDICQTLAQRVQEPGVDFVKDAPTGAFPTRLDKGRVQQVYTNFVTNAVKYTHEGHIRVGWRYTAPPKEAEGGARQMLKDITLQGAPIVNAPARGLFIFCEDTGAGIPEEKQASVFERFVKLNDFVQGTGLGLSICKTIAERCGGDIGLCSDGPGHGSTFWMWIPCERL